MSPEDCRPRCPRCGEPARFVVATARARFALTTDDQLGEVAYVHRRDARRRGYACGGGHEWGAEPE